MSTGRIDLDNDARLESTIAMSRQKGYWTLVCDVLVCGSNRRIYCGSYATHADAVAEVPEEHDSEVTYTVIPPLGFVETIGRTPALVQAMLDRNPDAFPF